MKRLEDAFLLRVMCRSVTRFLDSVDWSIWIVGCHYFSSQNATTHKKNCAEFAHDEYPRAYGEFSYGEVQPCVSPLYVSFGIGLYTLAFSAWRKPWSLVRILFEKKKKTTRIRFLFAINVLLKYVFYFFPQNLQEYHILSTKGMGYPNTSFGNTSLFRRALDIFWYEFFDCSLIHVHGYHLWWLL